MNITMFFSIPAALLYFLLALVVLQDCRTRRIPNKIVIPGAIAAIFMHTFLPSGSGFFGEPFGGLGFFGSVGGFATGLLLFFPIYALRAMGAGDVKMLAMIGAFVGPIPIVEVGLLSLLSGGVMAVLAAFLRGSLAQTFLNVRDIAFGSIFRMLSGGGMKVLAPPAGTGKLPYAIAIASGTVLYLSLANSHGRVFL